MQNHLKSQSFRRNKIEKEEFKNTLNKTNQNVTNPEEDRTPRAPDEHSQLTLLS